MMDRSQETKSDEQKVTATTGPGSGKKRGRPRKSLGPKTVPIDGSTDCTAVSENRLEENQSKDTETELSVVTPVEGSGDGIVINKRGRGRSRKSESNTIMRNVGSLNITASPVGKRKRSKPRRFEDSEEEDQEKSAKTTLKTEVNEDLAEQLTEHSGKESTTNEAKDIGSGSRTGRKKKRVDYSELNQGTKSETENNTVSVNRKKKTSLDNLQKGKESDNAVIDEPKSPPAKKKSGKQKVMLQCPKCESQFGANSGLQRHCAIDHQLWWTPENPEGDDVERASIRKVIKIRKFLNCKKCNKRINFPDYYFHHVEWCGREDETYTCEECGHGNLKAIWRSQHYLTCTAVVREAKKHKTAELEKKDGETGTEVEADGAGRKRKAARKALTMVHNLSQNLDPDDVSDNDRDPDVNINEEEDQDDDDDDDLDDDDEEEDEIKSEDLSDDEDFRRKGSTFKLSRAGQSYKVGPTGGEYGKYLDTFPLMLEYMKKNCRRTVYPDLLPGKDGWPPLSEKGRDLYLPQRKQSTRFLSDDGQEPVRLNLYEHSTINDFPAVFTGLGIWKIAWCPVPVHCTDDQYLAVVGKRDSSAPFLTTNRAGPDAIQIWNVGPLTATNYKVQSPPRLWYTVVHDFGQVTEIKWCPSGCYKSNSDQSDSAFYLRLGLLAVACRDGTVRIFSLPILPPPEDGQIRMYKPVPFISLYPNHRVEKIQISCTCLDWAFFNSHRKIIAGYSDGSVRLFNLDSTEPPLFLKFDFTSGRCFLPFQTFRAHGKLIRSVRWLCKFEDIVITACENFETYIWNLSNTECPVFQDPPVNMVTCMTSSLWHSGIFTGSDDNYAIGTNKGRYLEMGNMFYNTLTNLRKDETLNYNFSSQSACIWDVSFSNWLCYILSCDNRGNIHGTPMADTLVFQVDQKTYKFRNLFMTIKENQDGYKSASPEVKDQCSCDQTSCIKCNEKQTALSESNSNSSQSNSVLNSTDQSECVLESTVSSSVSSQSGDLTESTKNQPNQVTQSRNDQSDGVKQSCKNPSDDNYLKFRDHFKTFECGYFDTAPDQYNCLTQKPLKTISMNPNHLQCTWVAFGGDSGILRLANIYKMLPNKALKHFKQKKS